MEQKKPLGSLEKLKRLSARQNKAASDSLREFWLTESDLREFFYNSNAHLASQWISVSPTLFHQE